jgi:hypothetical protein
VSANPAPAPAPTLAAEAPQQALRPEVWAAVVMERTAAPNRWEDWGFKVTEVLAHDEAFGSEPRKLHDDGRVSTWLYPRMRLQLFVDECKGYFLNLSSGRPCWFVLWRVSEGDASMAAPEAVSMSYIEADRWLSAEEKVDIVPLQDDLCEWLREYTATHFKVEGGRKHRAQSFRAPQDRARLDTESP